MKAATGETTLTIITIVAIGVVIAFFVFFFDNNIKKDLEEDWNSTKTKEQ